MKSKTGQAAWKFLAFIVIAVLCLSLFLTGCGGGTAGSTAADAKQADSLEGNYIPVVGEMMGVALTGEDLSGFGIELQGGGKAVMTVEGDSHNVKWKSDETTITITVDGEDITGELGTDCFVVRDMLGMGMDLTFAKEGTPAADPAQYLPESEKYLLQDWQSVSVTDILGDPTDEIAPDAVILTFRGDHTADVSLEGKDLGSFKWGNVGDWGKLEGEDAPEVSWNIEEDGLSVDYVREGTYYTFFCPKDPAAYKTKAEAETGAEPETIEETEAETGEETESGTEAELKDGTAGLAALGEHGKAASSLYADYWDHDWYGWYEFESCDGDYEHLEGSRYDACGSIFVEDGDTGRIILWDEDGHSELAVCEVEVSFGPGTTDAGCMKSESGSFLSEEENVGHADWIVDPGASDLKIFDHMIEIDGEYEDEYGSLRYYVYLKPWGMDWEDVRDYGEDFLPWSYENWYLDVKDGPMPDRIGHEEMGLVRGEPERIESYTVLETPEYYPAGTLMIRECYLLPNNSLDNGADGYILDEDTVLEKPEELDGWESGDDPLSWMARLCDEGSMYSPAGVYDITVSGDHIDIIHGLYWWD